MIFVIVVKHQQQLWLIFTKHVT